MKVLSKYFLLLGSLRTRAMDWPFVYVNCSGKVRRRGKQLRGGSTTHKTSERLKEVYHCLAVQRWASSDNALQIAVMCSFREVATLVTPSVNNVLTYRVLHVFVYGAECLHLFKMWDVLVFVVQITAQRWGPLVLYHIHSTSSKHLTQNFSMATVWLALFTIFYPAYLLIM